MTRFADENPGLVGQQDTQTAITSGNICPHARECDCITEGVQATAQKKFILKGEERTLGGGGLPACHRELRSLLAPNQTGEQILACYAREPERKKPRASTNFQPVSA